MENWHKVCRYQYLKYGKQRRYGQLPLFRFSHFGDGGNDVHPPGDEWGNVEEEELKTKSKPLKLVSMQPDDNHFSSDFFS